MKVFDKIQRFEVENNLGALTIMELVVCYVDENNLELDDVGEELKKDKVFIKLFQADLIENNEASFKGTAKVKSFDGWI